MYQTARTDLLDLARQQILRAQKTGKTWYFSPAQDLEEKLAKTS